MARPDRLVPSLTVEFHLANGEVVRAPHSPKEVEMAIATVAKWSEVARAASEQGGRVSLSVALGTAYRAMLVLGGGTIIEDDAGGVWNIEESRVVGLRVVEDTTPPTVEREPRPMGFRFEKPIAPNT
jgi:hypothetical protein